MPACFHPFHPPDLSNSSHQRDCRETLQRSLDGLRKQDCLSLKQALSSFWIMRWQVDGWHLVGVGMNPPQRLPTGLLIGSNSIHRFIQHQELAVGDVPCEKQCMIVLEHTDDQEPR